MSSAQSDHAKTLLIIAWTVTTLATIGLGARLYTRYWRFSKFYWDDFFVVLAWIFSIPMAVQVTQASKHNTTINIGFQSLFLSRPISQLFSYNSLWAVKLSFLIFFRRIGVVALPAVKRFWTIVLILTIAAYFGTWLLNPYYCWVKRGIQMCDRDPSVRKFTPIALSMATVFDVVTDCLIVAIPFTILRNLRISLHKKLILYSIFSMELITMIVAIVRVVIAARGISKNRGFQIALLLFLTHIEANTAIIVACAGTLRSLFTQKGARSRTHAPWDSRPPNNDIVRPGKTETVLSSIRTPRKKDSDEELALTDLPDNTDACVDHASDYQPPKPFETDIPIDLDDLLKKP